jgi:hypothetical protein
VAFLAIAMLLVSSSARIFAASINYGSVGPIPPGVTFVDVTEQSGTDPVPLFGAPDPFSGPGGSAGLLFPDVNLVAHASGGGDFTDGQLTFMVTSQAGINSLRVDEQGTYTLSSLGGADALVRASAFITATVTQINGVNVAPISLTPVSASFSDSSPPDDEGFWSLNALLNVAGQLGANQRATKINFAIDNRLTALAEPGAAAFIDKKQFRITTTNIPEPTSLALAGLALCGILAAGRRRVEV